MAFPMGLPSWDGVYLALADTEHKGTFYGPDMLDASTAQLWWAGKEFLRCVYYLHGDVPIVGFNPHLQLHTLCRSRKFIL